MCTYNLRNVGKSGWYDFQLNQHRDVLHIRHYPCCCFTDIPELIVLTTLKRKLKVDVIYFTQCVPSWSYRAETTFNTLKIVLFYALPLLFMSVAYWQIVRVLWKSDNIPGHSETVNIHAQTNNSLCNCKYFQRLLLSSNTYSNLKLQRPYVSSQLSSFESLSTNLPPCFPEPWYFPPSPIDVYYNMIKNMLLKELVWWTNYLIYLF